jgi:hypothetical protein
MDKGPDPSRPTISAWHLRQALTLVIHGAGRPMEVAELVGAVERLGFAIAGRPSKAISDTLRGPVRRGWVVRLGRGRYAPGYLPKVTRHRMQTRLRQARDTAGPAVLR